MIEFYLHHCLTTARIRNCCLICVPAGSSCSIALQIIQRKIQIYCSTTTQTKKVQHQNGKLYEFIIGVLFIRKMFVGLALVLSMRSHAHFFLDFAQKLYQNTGKDKFPPKQKLTFQRHQHNRTKKNASEFRFQFYLPLLHLSKRFRNLLVIMWLM